MSIDSEISKCKKKINNIEKAIEEIEKAIGKYNEASDLLKGIKDVEICDDLKKEINTKVENLKKLVTKMKKEIDSNQSKIRSLKKQKNEQLNLENSNI